MPSMGAGPCELLGVAGASRWLAAAGAASLSSRMRCLRPVTARYCTEYPWARNRTLPFPRMPA
eukprot:5948257-Heterocapsa_arctica.AAC.1